MKALNAGRTLRFFVLCAGLLLLLATKSGQFVAAQGSREHMAHCQGGSFSTEQSFMSRSENKPYDGNPWISDGDLLSLDGTLCARNADLTRVYSATGAPLPDLGLDAVDILETSTPVTATNHFLVAFSTEIDEPNDKFTEGDLLATNGTIIPNEALVFLFFTQQDLKPYNVGLDELKFIGQPENILRFLEVAKSRSRASWLEGGVLQATLRQYDIDIWFTVEQTARGRQNNFLFLDGDILSARDGVIKVHQADLFPASIPAGIPARGVDFGNDAFVVSRDGNLDNLYFSTEISYSPTITGATSFSDGDILHYGDGTVALRNWDLIKNFGPATKDLGLDALFFRPGGGPCENKITNYGGLKMNEMDFGLDGLAMLENASGSEPGRITQHPHGDHVGFWGVICEDVKRFRVVFRKASDGPGVGTGIAVTPGRGWKVFQPSFIGCSRQPWSSDANGWYDAVRWHQINGSCDSVFLTDWYTFELGGGPGSLDANALYRVWLEFETTGGVMSREADDHFVQLDNKAPTVSGLSIPGGSCPTYSTADMPIMIQGTFHDDNFWYYQLSIGGDLYGWHYYTPVHFYDAVPAAAHINNMGTTPPATLEDLHRISVFDLVVSPDKPVRCAYGANLAVVDRTIIGYFNSGFNLVGGYLGRTNSFPTFFDYAP
ncbi:MAG: hypothetical protein EXR62_05215 [Chloroflexi bacterium]|nr:hypothetical protein [Chloroflexota bacterium]